jgi:hypothetical protein
MQEPVLRIRIRMDQPVLQISHHFDEDPPDSHKESQIRIRIKVKSRIRIRNRVKVGSGSP